MKIKIEEITDRLHEDVDSAIVDDFFKGIKSKVDNRGYIDLDDAEVQLYFRDFMEKLKIQKDYQANTVNEILKSYYKSEYDIKEESIKLQEANLDEYDLIIHTGLNDDASEEALSSVLGQMSDGMWENSARMDKYWPFADIERDGSEVCICIKTKADPSNYYSVYSGWSGKSEEEIKKYFANKLKQVIKAEGLEWSRNNTEMSDYLSSKKGVTVQDAYRVYDQLLGRKNRIDVKTEAKEPEEFKGMESKLKKFCRTYELKEDDLDGVLETLDVLEGEFGDSSGEYEEIREYVMYKINPGKSDDEEVETELDIEDTITKPENGDVEVYQMKNGSEYHRKRFEPYKYNQDINRSMYDKVAVITEHLDDKDKFDINSVLESIFSFGNSSDWSSQFKTRSISVSDVIKIKDRYYYVDSFGFQDVTDKFVEKVTETIYDSKTSLFDEFKSLSSDYYEDEWNSADAEGRYKLAKEALTDFIGKHRKEFRDTETVKTFRDELEDNNFNTEANIIDELYKLNESKKVIEAKEDKFQVEVNGISKTLKTQDDKDCFEAMIRALHGYEKFIETFECNIKEDCFVILGTEADGQLYAIEFSKESFGKVTKIYTVADNIQLSKTFVQLTDNLARDFKELL